ncbi:MAG: Bax inhibitor-1/YccA family protein [Polyangiales bacterium]
MYPVPQNPYSSRALGYETEGFLSRVYTWMAGGLAVTGLTALAVSSSAEAVRLLFTTPLMWGLLIAQFVMVVAFAPLAARVSPAVAGAMFLAYSALTGATLSSIFLVYTATSIAATFFVTAGAFAAMSAYGALTKRSLASWGAFLFMGLVGIILASIVNIFLASAAVQWIASMAGVVVFTGLAAYDTQRIKEVGDEAGPNAAVQGALTLYLDFINLFLMLLRLFGGRRD